MRPSPYNSVQCVLISKHFIMGNPKDESNPFSWDRIELNVPGSQNYDYSKPWIMKVRKDGELASGVAQYIDNIRVMAYTKDFAWKSSSRMAKGLSYLGLQDAARKQSWELVTVRDAECVVQLSRGSNSSDSTQVNSFKW